MNGTRICGRPLIVLAGWLGAQPKHLRRYQELYLHCRDSVDAGGDAVVLRYITPPHTVVREVIHPMELNIDVPKDWPQDWYRGNNTRCNGSIATRTIQSLTWKILADVAQLQQQQKCNRWMFHAFSNGGCFVWERIRNILQSDSYQDHDTICNLKRTFAGVVFDSCPALELHRLEQALVHCTLAEKVAILWHNGINYIRMNHDQVIQRRTHQRCEDYANGMRNDALTTPQLYLYSKDDPLAPYTFIEQLVEHRKRLIGHDVIFQRVWDISVHCGHLLKHPKEYEMSVKAFVQICLDTELMGKHKL